MMGGEPILEVRGADVFYGTSQILFGFELTVERGQTMALMGRNGAGKSTTFKCITGLVPLRRGTVLLRGQPVSGRAPYRIARAGIGYVPEDRQVFPEHTVDDNLIIAAKRGPRGDSPWTISAIYDVFPLLAGMRSRLAGRLSGGEQQMLAIARTLMGNPDLLLLDEPSEGLAPLIVASIGQLIRTLRDSGVSILVAEQNMHFCLAIATHASIVDKGQVVYRGSIEALRADGAVTQRYLAV